ncbi:hypothetical protein Leryth_002843 [Lithospermum erythrorhizon]|nr:hypothetical protein Leryth_002843 [Lithospermum erythrorhizon]
MIRAQWPIHKYEVAQLTIYYRDQDVWRHGRSIHHLILKVCSWMFKDKKVIVRPLYKDARSKGKCWVACGVKHPRERPRGLANITEILIPSGKTSS